MRYSRWILSRRQFYSFSSSVSFITHEATRKPTVSEPAQDTRLCRPPTRRASATRPAAGLRTPASLAACRVSNGRAMQSPGAAGRTRQAAARAGPPGAASSLSWVRNGHERPCGASALPPPRERRDTRLCQSSGEWFSAADGIPLGVSGCLHSAPAPRSAALCPSSAPCSLHRFANSLLRAHPRRGRARAAPIYLFSLSASSHKFTFFRDLSFV